MRFALQWELRLGSALRNVGAVILETDSSLSVREALGKGTGMSPLRWGLFFFGVFLVGVAGAALAELL